MLLVLLFAVQEASPARWDLGDVLMNEEFRAEFQIVSRVSAKVTAALVNCACLKVELSSYDLSPDKPVVLKGRLITSGLIGLHDKAFQLVIDDQKTLVIPVRFNVWSGSPPPAGTQPDLILWYPPDAPDRHEVLGALVQVASAKGRTYVVRTSDQYLLQVRERSYHGKGEILVYLGAGAPPPPQPPALPLDRYPVSVRYYYWPACPKCAALAAELKRRSHTGLVKTFDLSDFDTLSIFLAECRRAGIRPPASAAFVGRRVLVDDDALNHLDEAIEAESRSDRATGHEPSVNPALVHEQAAAIGLGVVILAGLVDGINPCAFATIVFLISFLSVTHRERRPLLTVGAAYAAATFITYFLLGLGALAALRSLRAFETASLGFALVVAAATAALGVVSLIDGVRYGRSGRSEDVILQLPAAAKRSIHDVIRSRLRGRGLLVGGFVAGVLVTLFETACTGQIYLPTLVVMTRRPEWAGRAWTGLVAYNLAFIVPLVVVTLAAALGLSHQRLAGWARRHVAGLKFASGALFLALAGILVWFSIS